jgi:hypothetical protein
VAGLRPTDDRGLTPPSNRPARVERHGFKGRQPNRRGMSTSTKLVVATVAIAAVLSVFILLNVA